MKRRDDPSPEEILTMAEEIRMARTYDPRDMPPRKAPFRIVKQVGLSLCLRQRIKVQEIEFDPSNE